VQFLKSIEVKIRQLRNYLTPMIYSGDAVYCPVCEHSFRKFLAAGSGHRHREGAVCPYCRARERDRLTWLFIQSRPELFEEEGMQFLHVAPEPRLGRFFQGVVGHGYISADLMRKDVMVTLDVMSMQYPDDSFDAIYCSHVFQDVPDDLQAMRECYRTLRPGGWAILNVPIHTDRTHDNEAPDNVRASWDKRPDEHVRSYGLDYGERLASVGFTVETLAPADLAHKPEDRLRLGIAGDRVGYVHFVRKPAA
jgi:SAM-dependent methyltransferase